MEKQQPFEREELERAVSRGNIHHTLNNQNLKRAAQNIFQDQSHITKEFYQNTVVAGNYDGFDLEKHGFSSLLQNLRILTEFFRSAIHLVDKTTKQKSDRVMFMGEGQGRTSIAAIEIAKQLRVKEVCFNDLLTDHIDHIREKIAKCYGTRSQVIDDVKISFVPGDFIDIAENTKKEFDAIFAMWFVTSEICDFSSIEKLSELRKKLYSGIKKLLTKQGVFIEEIPFSEGIGAFYYTARLKTYKILQEMGILEVVRLWSGKPDKTQKNLKHCKKNKNLF